MTTKDTDFMRPWDCPVCSKHNQKRKDIELINQAILMRCEQMRLRWSGFSEDDVEDVGQAWARLLIVLEDYA